MSAIALQFPSGRDYPRRSFTRLVLNLINRFREAQEISYRYEQLSHLSDAELIARNATGRPAPHRPHGRAVSAGGWLCALDALVEAPRDAFYKCC